MLLEVWAEVCILYTQWAQDIPTTAPSCSCPPDYQKKSTNNANVTTQPWQALCHAPPVAWYKPLKLIQSVNEVEDLHWGGAVNGWKVIDCVEVVLLHVGCVIVVECRWRHGGQWSHLVQGMPTSTHQQGQLAKHWSRKPRPTPGRTLTAYQWLQIRVFYGLWCYFDVGN